MTTPPRRPTPRLPSPSVCEDGSVACNEPLVVDDVIVGYCRVFVKPHWSGLLRRTPPMTHPGKQHEIRWGSR